VVRTGGEEQFQYLPIECPKCGLSGKVKISRLDQTFTCKRCKKVFHMTLDGAVLGERPPDAPADESGLVTADDRPPWLVRRFEQLSRAWQWIVLGLVVAALCYGVALWMEPEKPLSGELEDRAVLAAKAFGYGDWKTIKRLAKHGAAGDLGSWYDAVRPESWADVTKESAVEVELGRPTQDFKGYAKSKSKATAKPILAMTTPAKIEVRGKPACDIDLVWSEDEHAEWWLDGEQMLKNLPRGKKPAKKGAAGTPAKGPAK